MKLFLDTANQREVEQAVEMGVINGVTTNPSLVAKETGDYLERVQYFARLVEGPISVEVLGKDKEIMVIEARKLAALGEHIVVKIPLTKAGLSAMRILAQEGIKVNATLIFSANQALLAAQAGACYVSPFIGRLGDIGQDGQVLLREIRTILDLGRYDTQIIAASIRNPRQVTDAALAGADIATVPYAILEQMVQHPQTDLGIARFEADWQKRR